MSGGDVQKVKVKPCFCNGARTQTLGGRAEKQKGEESLEHQELNVHGLANIHEKGTDSGKDKFACA